MADVVCFGSAILDILVKSGDFKVLKSHQLSGGVALCEVYGGKTEVDHISLAAGGGGTNAAVSFNRLGLAAVPVADIGDDDSGDYVLKKLKPENLNLNLLRPVPGGQTGISVVLIAPDGGRSILTARGVAAKLTSKEIPWEKLYQTKWFYVSSLGGNLALLEDIVFFAVKHGIHLALNPGRGELNEKARLKKLFGYLDVLLLNRMELAKLLGHDYEDREALLEDTKTLGCKLVVMSEGKTGASAIKPYELVKVDAFRVKSVDDTGAGDAFGSGTVAGLIKGYPLAKALKLGSANGASVVTQMGSQGGLLTQKESLKWLKKKLTVVEG